MPESTNEGREAAEFLAAMRWDEGRSNPDTPAWSELVGCEDMKRSWVNEARGDIEEIAPFLAQQDQKSIGVGEGQFEDLTRWILDALELPADMPENAEAWRAQRKILAALRGWFSDEAAVRRESTLEAGVRALLAKAREGFDADAEVLEDLLAATPEPQQEDPRRDETLTGKELVEVCRNEDIEVSEAELAERRKDPAFRARLERSIEENRELLERLGAPPVEAASGQGEAGK